MSFQFHKGGEKPEWLPEAGYHLLACYDLDTVVKDWQDGKGPTMQAVWGFVVVGGEQAGKRLVEYSSMSFYDGQGTGKGVGNPAKAYSWYKALKFKGKAPAPDYLPDSADVIGRIAYAMCAENEGGRIRVSKDMVPVTALPDGVTLETIKATCAQAVVDAQMARDEALANAGGGGNGHVAAGEPDVNDPAFASIPF